MNHISISLIIIALLLLLCFSAFFSGSETALMAVSRRRLRYLAKTKPKEVSTVEGILRKPERLIGAILLGNNLVNVAMAAIATVIAVSFWGERGVAYVTVVLTLIILIFAEITPKVYAKYYNERVSMMIAPILRVLMAIFSPVVIAVTFLASKILSIAGVDISKTKRPLLSEDELKAYVQMGLDDGAITLEEQKMLSRVFTMNDKEVSEIMVPRNKMTVIDFGSSTEQISRTIQQSGYSRLPVSKGKDMDIIGFIHAKDLVGFASTKKTGSLKKIMRQPYFIPGDKKIDAQLRSFKAKRLHQAIVLDKGGEVIGLITLEDILEELVGSIRDEHDPT